MGLQNHVSAWCRGVRLCILVTYVILLLIVATVSAEDTEWPQKGGDDGRTGMFDGQLPSAPHIRWKAELEGTPEHVVYCGGRLFAAFSKYTGGADFTYRIVAMDPMTGDTLWSVGGQGSVVTSSPICDGDQVIVGVKSGWPDPPMVVSYAMENGNTRWVLRLPDSGMSSMASVGDHIAISGWGGKTGDGIGAVYTGCKMTIITKDGSLVRTLDNTGVSYEGASDGQYVYWSRHSYDVQDTVAKYGATTGSMAAERTLSTHSSPVVTPTRVFTSDKTTIYALTTSNLQYEWTFSPGTSNLRGGIFAFDEGTGTGDGVLYAPAAGYLYALPEDDPNFDGLLDPMDEPLWFTPIEDHTYGSLIVSERFIILPDSNGVVSAFWRTNGSKAWDIDIGSTIRQGLAVTEGVIFIPTSNGVVAIDAVNQLAGTFGEGPLPEEREAPGVGIVGLRQVGPSIEADIISYALDDHEVRVTFTREETWSDGLTAIRNVTAFSLDTTKVTIPASEVTGTGPLRAEVRIIGLGVGEDGTPHDDTRHLPHEAPEPWAFTHDNRSAAGFVGFYTGGEPCFTPYTSLDTRICGASDAAMGGYYALGEDLALDGNVVTSVSPNSLATGVLSGGGPRILVLPANQRTLEEAEIAALTYWVQQGHGLLILTEWAYGETDFGASMDPLLLALGVATGQNAPTSTITTTVQDEWWSLLNISSLTGSGWEVEYEGASLIPTYPQGSIPVTTTPDGTPLAVALPEGLPQTGAGRIVIAGDSSWLDSIHDTDDDGTVDYLDADNRMFALSILRWLDLSYGVSLDMDDMVFALPGRTNTFDVTITNEGRGVSDTYTLGVALGDMEYSGDEWSTLGWDPYSAIRIHTSPIELGPGRSITVPVEVYIPEGALPGEKLSIVLTATSNARMEASDEHLLRVEVLPRIEGEFSIPDTRMEVIPGGPVLIPLKLTNTGNVVTGYTVTLSSSGRDDLPLIDQLSLFDTGVATGSIGPGATIQFPLLIETTPTTAADPDLIISVRGSLFPDVTIAPLNITVDILATHHLGVPETLEDAPFSEFPAFTISNLGNVAENVTVSMAGMPGTWSATPRIMEFTLPPGAQSTVEFDLSVPTTEEMGSHPVSLLVSSIADDGIRSLHTISTNVEVPLDPSWEIGHLLPDILDVTAGEVIEVPLLLSNWGNVRFDASCEAFGEEVNVSSDTVHIPGIAGGGSRMVPSGRSVHDSIYAGIPSTWSVGERTETLSCTLVAVDYTGDPVQVDNDSFELPVDVAVTIQVNELELGGLALTGPAEPLKGTLVPIRGSVRNDGLVTVRGLEAILLDDDVPVQRRSLLALSPGRTKTVNFLVTAASGSGPFSMSILDLTSSPLSMDPVDELSTSPMSGPVGAVVGGGGLVALLLVAILVSRKRSHRETDPWDDAGEEEDESPREETPISGDETPISGDDSPTEDETLERQPAPQYQQRPGYAQQAQYQQRPQYGQQRGYGQQYQQSQPTSRCGRCGTGMDPSWKLCPNCGAAPQRPVVSACPSCRGQIQPGWAMCPMCGTKLR